MPAIILFAIVAFFIIIAFLLLSNSQKTQNDAWANLAAKHDLSYTPRSRLGRSGLLHGTYRSHTLRALIYAQSNGKATHYYTRLAFLTADQHATFTISDKSFFANLSTVLGQEDATIGHPPFDDRFIIRTNNPTFIRQLFSHDTLRQKLLHTPNLDITLTDQYLYHTDHGFITDNDRLETIMNLLADIMDHLPLPHTAPPATTNDPWDTIPPFYSQNDQRLVILGIIAGVFLTLGLGLLLTFLLN
ncbi:MAG TPA: hypothetical protein VLL52_17350 [Anaerolineae bacterium]|nr:hypothetical protein [Anaerolineae bacterium]